MNSNSKQISNSASTGGLGIHFENRVQTAFSVLMLVGGFAPCLPAWPIVKIKLQAKYQGFETDDLIVYCEEPNSRKKARLIGQIRHSVDIIKSDSKFCEVIQAAWKDFNNPEVFEAHLKKANNNIELTKDKLWKFLKSFHLLIYDLDIKGVILPLFHTLIKQNSSSNPEDLWAKINEHVQYMNENSGFISISSIPEDIKTAFKRVPVEVIPDELVKAVENALQQTPCPFDNIFAQ